MVEPREDVPVTVGEARMAALHHPMDPYHRHLISELADQVEALRAERDRLAEVSRRHDGPGGEP